jgi:hypothetical protein
MTNQGALSVLGIAIQLGGAGYLLWTTWSASRRLAAYCSPVRYDTFSTVVESLAKEIAGQFAPQKWGFVALAIGSIFQAWGALIG